jgi:hypothetical protein
MVLQSINPIAPNTITELFLMPVKDMLLTKIIIFLNDHTSKNKTNLTQLEEPCLDRASHRHQTHYAEPISRSGKDHVLSQQVISNKKTNIRK